MDLVFFPKKALGIDIGVSSIKLVEVAVSGDYRRLENYVEFRFPGNGQTFQAFDKGNLSLKSEEVAEVLKGLLKKVGLKQKKAAFAIPDFSTLFTTFSLPPMKESEIDEAVKFEARHHIPVPLSQVSFDWKVAGGGEKGASKLDILLVAVPNSVLSSYQKVASMCQLDLQGVEAEVFGLARAAIPIVKKHQPICLVDFGWQSTTISIVENKSLRASFSFDISGTGLSQALSAELKVSLSEAENLKKKYGLNPAKPRIYNALIKKAADLSDQIDKVCRDFFQAQEREVKSIVLSGGTAWLFGLKDYLQSRLEKEVALANPFTDFHYPVQLSKRLEQIGPSFAVSLGVAMMGAGS